jgi:glycosyltransferase involved in cell wall biosynthesis
MILGIDATNIRGGGGLTHLTEILLNAEPSSHGFEKVIVWSNNDTLSKLPNLPWLVKKTHRWLNKSVFFSFLFQKQLLSKQATEERCTILFVPGGTFLGNFKHILSMSQNMLPFEKEESARFTSLKTRLRFKILHYTQKKTFKKSDGIIFLTHYAKNYIAKAIGLKNDFMIIPHGIKLSFVNSPKTQKDISEYSFDNPFKLLYVSILNVYKHQWNVAEAILKLRQEGYPVHLDFVGGSHKESLQKLKNVLVKDKQNCLNYVGEIPYEELENVYKKADAFVFASSCENMPIILIEAMTSGLPISSSNMGPMPEVLEDAGFYFDPLKVDDIYNSIKYMLESVEQRRIKSQKSYQKSINYTWKDCSDKTFEYFSKIAKKVK